MGHQSKDRRVLIIDDDAAVRQTMTLLAESCGFEAIATDDAAVFKAHLASWLPTLIILDLQMPGRDGVQLLGDLGGETCGAQVILATGALPRTLDAAQRVGREHGLKMAGTLQKPFQLETVRALLARFEAPPNPPAAEIPATIDDETERPGFGDPSELSVEELSRAIETGQLFLEYQPKRDCRGQQISGVEALVRWRHPLRGRIAPDRFIGLAERSGLIDRLTDWVFGAAVRQAAAWRDAGLDLDVAINISARNLHDADLPDRFARKCDELVLDLSSIILEVTESSAMRDPLHSLEVLTRLRVKGFRLAMDDFGTAYSSLVQLQRMPFSELKIDRSFVINMIRDKSCKVIAEIITDLAHNLGLKCVAEGVENEGIWDAVRAMGCDTAQGYHLSRPVSAECIASLILGAGANRRP
jgi:EAL domain-containing protein (putative c-di-GMP-specific phosphodiesterase class I)/ActR/RegA family two-component response regulator